MQICQSLTHLDNASNRKDVKEKNQVPVKLCSELFQQRSFLDTTSRHSSVHLSKYCAIPPKSSSTKLKINKLIKK